MQTPTDIPIDSLIKLRKWLHQNPELAWGEEATAKRIVDFLRPYKPQSIIEGIAGTGVAAVFKFSDDGPTVLIRCELDALPIQEINEFEYRSAVDHVSHKCGHDGHMTMVAGVAHHLSKHPPKRGKVVLLFQPAEETGEGAKKVLEDRKFQQILPDYVFALHNLPGYEKHCIICRPNTFTASVKSMIIKLHGKTSHAGEPDRGINPALAIAEILQKTHRLQVSRDEPGFKQVTPIQIEMGEEAFGVSAGYGEVKLTIRSWDNEVMEELADQCDRIAVEVGHEHGLGVEVKWTQYFAANQNDPEMVELVKRSAEQNGFGYKHKKRPFRWGEDFGHFSKQFEGAMFGLGSGEKTPALHNPDYDFPDEIIPTGVAMFTTIIDKLLKE